ncbi:MAG: hypothetical protein V3W34_04935, partial [Phycisphaerae bacterium]
FGSTGEEQMQLLMDFMYNAGVKNYTAIQPGGLPDAGEAAFDESEEEEEEEEEGEEEGYGAEDQGGKVKDDEDDWGP